MQHWGYQIIKTPADGNCLVTAAVNQIYGLEPSSEECRVLSKQLREEVIYYVSANRSRQHFHLSLLTSARDVISISNDEDGMVKEYIEYLSKDGIWLGEETLMAISEFYQVRVEVFQLQSSPIIYGLEYNWIVRLLYRNNHYDSLVKNNNSTCGRSIELSVLPQYKNIHTDSSNFRLIENTPSPRQFLEIKEVNKIKVGSMNVRGCAQTTKRLELDLLWKNEELDIVALQETNMIGTENLTTNYRWFLSCKKKDQGQTGKCRNGVGIVDRLNGDTQIIRFVGVSERICYATVTYKKIKKFIIICIHVPTGFTSSRVHSFYTRLSILLMHLSKKREILVLGDFNAHLGKDLRDTGTSKLIGQNLHHSESNIYGQMMYDFVHQHSLKVCTSWGKNSARVTWRNSKTKSQLDHILIKGKTLKFGAISGKWTELSDHKLITCSIWKVGEKNINSERCEENKYANTHDERHIILARNWNMDLLKESDSNERYQEAIKTELEDINIETVSSSLGWRLLVNAMRKAANKELRKQLPLTPRRRKSLAQLKQAIYMRKCNNIDNSVVSNKREIYNQECRRAKREACFDFFSGLNKYNPQQRIKKTFQFIRQHRREIVQNKGAYIPLSVWEQELRNSQGVQVSLINETDYWPIEEPPDLEELMSTVREIRLGTAPGIDQIPTQLIVCLPEIGWNLLLRVMQNAWMTNSNPEEWLDTVQVPLKKIPYPKTTADYRRITITDVGYRIYAKMLLGRMTRYMEDIGTYQAAFLKNRSTDDHMFAVRRVMEEEWRLGRTLYVLSLDIKKAFDSVDLGSLKIMLKNGGLPHHLINRIIKTCLWERTSIMWCQQRTSTVEKNIGMKQGCPLSPHLFNIVLDNVLQTLAEVLSYIKLDQHEQIQLPLLLAYADDIVILNSNVEQLSNIVSELVELLETVGLKINENKSEILIRSPLERCARPQTLSIGGMNIKVKNEIRYLGTQLTSELNRKETVKTRCGKALGLSRMLSSFVKNNKIPSDTVIKMYKAIITPLLSYGLKAAALTKANRIKLKRYEQRIFSEMLKFSTLRPPSRSARQALLGKTISKRVTVYRICYWGHVLRRSRGHILNAVLRYAHITKKIGRPCYTWNTSLKQDFGKFNVSAHEWRELAKDKKKLKEKAETLYADMGSTSGETTEIEWSEEEYINHT